MKPSMQIAILKTVVRWQAQEIEVLQERVKALEQEHKHGRHVDLRGGPLKEPERSVLTGSIEGDTETLTVTWPPKWDDTDGMDERNAD